MFNSFLLFYFAGEMKKTVRVKPGKDHTTEERIKVAAKKVFTQKGYAATRTRDIAAEAGINLALLNYYFRSKEKLFDIVMLETMHHFVEGMTGILNDAKTTFYKKVELIVSNYIDLLIGQPEIPLFIINEISKPGNKVMAELGIRDILVQSVFAKQFRAELKKRNAPRIHPIQFAVNIIGITVIPFIARPIVQQLGNLEQSQFNNLMLERKKLIPVWIETIMKSK